MQPFEDAKKIWGRMSNGNNPLNTLSINTEEVEKLNSIFGIGEYYYYIFNVKTTAIESVSDKVKNILGYSPNEFTMSFIFERIHHEDIPFFLNFESAAIDFFQTLPQEKVAKYKIRYDFRIRKKDGGYIRVLQQVLPIEISAEGEIIKSLGLHTDINHIKKNGKPVLSFIGLDGEPSYIDVQIRKSFVPTEELLSSREKQVLQHIISGKSSEEIASALFLSKETVSTHRRNMLKKTHCRNTSELIAMYIKEGYV
jgi:DNA-binding CsgD family transcriptional regulator